MAELLGKSDKSGEVGQFTCPWCERASTAGIVTYHEVLSMPSNESPGSFVLSIVGKCRHADCGRPIIFVGEGRVPWVSMFAKGPQVHENNRPPTLQTYPAALPKYDEPDVPDFVRDNYEEALACEASGFLNAAAVTGRRALQLAVRDKLDREERTLEMEIDALPDAVLSPKLKAVAHQVRLIGNDGAHDKEGATAEDVDQLFRFNELIFRELYITPAQLADAQELRPHQPRRQGKR